MSWSGRGGLALLALGLVLVFAVAAWLRPYGPDGQPLRQETHTQLGLPPCTFYRMTGLPCPSCGMTTSFALLMHGDLWHSLCANAVGTMLAAFCLALIPWSIASAVSGRLLGVASLERAALWLVLGLVVIMLLRWAIVLSLIWGARGHDRTSVSIERHGFKEVGRWHGFAGSVCLSSCTRSRCCQVATCRHCRIS